jgi:enamine deaminase RidA (YjgF/YER057c/UK114 family)
MRNYLEGTATQKQRAYSPAVVTQGGRTVWLAGHTATQDSEGRDISYNFEAQVRQVFRDLANTLRRAGGTLADMVTMTVFILDSRLGTRFTEMRREAFTDGKYPASALITVSSFARPGIVIEIQGIAVIDADT